MTPTEYKTLEGQRIQAIMAAIAALPGAALVASEPQGAPFFAAALVTVAAAFMFWIYTDGIYHFSTVPNHTPDEWSRLLRVGGRYQWATLGYGALSIFLTMAGFAGVHSDIRVPLTVDEGFRVDGVLFLTVLAHVLWSSHERNSLATATRAVSLRNLGATQ